VTTTGGRELTLINPAYMTRQVHELSLEQYGLMGHITSLDPLRPANRADDWETQALMAFEQGAERVSSVETMDGRPYLRFMKPLVTREGCLGCHGHQGYVAGDIHGGISVSVPWEPYVAQSGKQKIDLGIAHALIGILGLLGLGMGHRLVRRSDIKLSESRDYTAATLRAIGDGVISCDNQGRIQKMNPAAERLTGWSLGEALGRAAQEVFRVEDFHDRGKVENPVFNVLRDGQTREHANHSVLLSKDGKKMTIKMNCSPIRNRPGRIVGAVLVFRDVTREHTAHLLTHKRLELYEYAASHSLDELMTRVLDDAEEFVDSAIGFFHFVEKDQKTLSLQRWSTRSLRELCHMPGNKMHYSIDQAGVWVEAAFKKKPVIHNDYESMPDKKGLPKGHARVIRELVVPIIRDDMIVAIMGVGNKPVDYDDKDIEIVSFFADLTWNLVEQSRTRQALKNSEVRLKTITNAAHDAIIMIDNQGLVSYWNPAAETILGYSSEQAMGRNLHQLIMPARYESAFQASFPKFQRTGQGNAVNVTTELYALKKNGQEIPVDLALSAVSIHGQWHAVGIVRDITQQKEAEEELRRNADNLAIKNAELDAARIKAEEATRAKSEFLANMSHEIRTPMNGVIGMTGLLLDTNLDDEQHHYARTVRSSAESLLTVINDILDFSKIEAGRLDIESIDFDLEAMLMDFSGMMAVKAEEKGLELICSLAPDVPNMVRGDPGRLRQILMNLVGNAIKFTEQGEVVVRIEGDGNAGMLESRDVYPGQPESASECSTVSGIVQAESGRRKVEDEPHAAHGEPAQGSSGQPQITLLFTIRDTGMGIPADKQDRLFQSFSQVDASTTRKFGGTGLGLAISRQLAEMMGGAVGLESEEGQGSIFWFTARLGLQDRQQEYPAPACLQGVRILVVDDNRTNREILMARLGSWNMRPEEASDGPSALRLLHQARADDDPFVVAALDMQMPGMDGETLGRRIKEDEKLQTTRLVMLSSATGQKGDTRRLQEAGFDVILSKPVLPNELHATLLKVLAMSDSTDLVAEFTQTQEIRSGYADFSGTKARILVAEDNVVNQQVALGMLKKFGLRADTVANGREALHALRTIPYDLVLMDVQMPEMDGLEATREMRRLETDNAGILEYWNAGIENERGVSDSANQNKEAPYTAGKPSQRPSIPASQHSRIPIIAMTAGAMREDRERCFEAGMDDYVPKPVKPEELARALKKWLPTAGEGGRETEGEERKAEGGREESGGRSQEAGGVRETEQEGKSEGPLEGGDLLSVFDRGALLERCMNDDELVREVLNIFLDNVPQRIQELQAALDAEDAPAARMAAHTIKGMAANTSAEALRKLAGEMEAAARDEDLVAVQERMANLADIFENVRTVCV